jgi:uncharacterized membrane protein
VKQQTSRLQYLDWMRGLAALIMLQGHAFDSWLRPEQRSGEVFWLSQFLGGLPAPIFLFLVGVSLALVLDRLRAKGAGSLRMVLRVVKRGSSILLLAYAFRIEQFLIWYPASRWSDIFRVDTLNCIGASFLVIGLLSVALRTRTRNLIVLGLLSAVVVVSTPWIYAVRGAVPDFLLDYMNGNGRTYYFSLIPWVAFTLLGITFGYALLEAREQRKEPQFFSWIAGLGIMAYAIGLTMPFFKIFEYGFYDYSLTSSAFFLVRTGWLSLILYGAYQWSQRSTAGRWSPLQTFGQASLLVYWVHMELVYGKPLHHFERSLDISTVMQQLLWLVPAMLLIAAIRRYGVVEMIGTVREYLPIRRKPCEDSGRAITECATHRTRLLDGICHQCSALRLESVGQGLD